MNRLWAIAAVILLLAALGMGAMRAFESWKENLIDQAIEGYVSVDTLAAVRAEAQELRRRLNIEEEINAQLNRAAAAADQALAEMEAEIRTYGDENEAPADCRVSDDLLDLLR